MSKPNKQALSRRGVLGALCATGTMAASGLPRFASAQTVSARPEITAFVTGAKISQIALSPDGQSVAILVPKGDDTILMTYKVAAPKPTQLLLGRGKYRNLFWGSNEQVVVINSQTDSLGGGPRSEWYMASWIDPAKATIETFFDKSDEFRKIAFSPFVRIKMDGQYRVTASNYNGGRKLIAFAPGKSFGLELMSAIDVQDFVFSPGGTPIAYSTYSDEDRLWQLYFNVGTPGSSKYVSVLSVKNTDFYPAVAGIGRDGKSVALWIYDDNGEAHLHEVSSDGAKGPELFAELTGKSYSPLFHPVTKCLDGYALHDDWLGYHFTDPNLKAMTEALPKILGEDRKFTIADFADDPRKMLVYSEGPNDGGSYILVDFEKSDFNLVGEVYPDIPPEWVSPKKPIDYKAQDGLNIHAYLTLPPQKEAKNLALIVLPHGGPQARDYADFDPQVQALASRGYAILQPNFRGSTGYGAAFINAAYAQYGRKMQTDLIDGIHHLAKQGVIDPQRVAIVGASYGGYAALAGATLNAGTYRCAVSIAGPGDVKMQMDFRREHSGSLEGESIRNWRRLLGDEANWDEISPQKQAAKASCPILLIHGTDDTVVPIQNSWSMEAALKAAKKPVEMISFKGQDHWESLPRSTADMFNAVVSFVEKHNPA